MGDCLIKDAKCVLLHFENLSPIAKHDNYIAPNLGNNEVLPCCICIVLRQQYLKYQPQHVFKCVKRVNPLMIVPA